MSDEWYGVTRDEYECDRLLSTQDEADWRAARGDDDVPRPTRADMIARWAGERAAIMAGYDPREFRWWNSDIVLRPWAYDEADPRFEGER